MALTRDVEGVVGRATQRDGSTPSRGTTRDIVPPHTGHEKQLAARVSARAGTRSSRLFTRFGRRACFARDGRPALLNARDDANGRDAAGDAGVELKLLTLAMRIATAARGQAHGRGA